MPDLTTIGTLPRGTAASFDEAAIADVARIRRSGRFGLARVDDAFGLVTSNSAFLIAFEAFELLFESGKALAMSTQRRDGQHTVSERSSFPKRRQKRRYC